MRQNPKIKRNVFIILFGILLFAAISQVTRSEWILKFTSYDSLFLIDQFEKIENISPRKNYLVSDTLENNQHCLVYDSKDEISVSYLDNFTEAYRYIKQPYNLYDVQDGFNEFKHCKVVVTMSQFEKISNVHEILDSYVYDGGLLFIAKIDQPEKEFSTLYRKLGIVNYQYLYGNTGIELTSNILIGQNGEDYSDVFFYNDSLLVDLENTSEVLAQGSHAPIAWLTPFGEGKVLVYNGNNLQKKKHRGLIVGALGKLIPEYIYPIYNTKLFYIDDYPAPMSNEENEKITDEYSMNMSEFYRNIWWPDMIKVSKMHDVKYTSVAILDYNEVTQAPLPDYRQEDLTNLIIFGREILKLGGEIGIHGYNHQPLQFDEEVAKSLEYKVWNSEEDMGISIEKTLDYLKKAFPTYEPISYVPPSNILGEEGRRVLFESWDTLKIISSVYENEYEPSTYGQEFEIADDGILEMPRITAGYVDTQENKWLEANVLTAHGFISHFIHPDDIFDDYRSGDMKWSELYKGFDAMLKRIRETYPWLKAKTSGEAGYHISTVLKSDVNRAYSDSKVSVSIGNFVEPQYFIFRTEKDIVRLNNCTIEKIDEATYLVKAVESDFYIEVK